jgi:hypothetical protein
MPKDCFSLRKFLRNTLTTKRTKVTKDSDMILFYLRALRDLRGESSVSSWVAALPHCDLRGEMPVSTLVVGTQEK